MQLKNQSFSNLLEINLAMLLVGTSGVLGRYISLSPPLTIAVRAVLAFLLLFVYCRYKGFSFKIEKDHRIPIVCSGLFLGAHWVTYFYSLQLSNVAIGMLSLFTYPVITAFLEPLLLRTQFQKAHLFLGLLVLTGIFLLNPTFDFKNEQSIAVAIGIFSAVLYSLRNIILKNRVGVYNGSSLMCFQMGVIAVFLAPSFLSTEVFEIPTQLPWIFTLALLTTAIGHTLFLNCFRYFSITTISILSSVQPIYGILLGALFLKEIPQLTTIFGGICILSAVVIESIRTQKNA